MPKNNEQRTMNAAQNKPNQSQFQTHKQLTQLAGREMATHSTALRAGSVAIACGVGVTEGETRAGLLCEALRRLPEQRSPCYDGRFGGAWGRFCLHRGAMSVILKVIEKKKSTNDFFSVGWGLPHRISPRDGGARWAEAHPTSAILQKPL